MIGYFNVRSRKMMGINKRVYLGALTAFAVLLVACGGGSDPTDVSGPTGTSGTTTVSDPGGGSGPQETVQTYFDALAEGNSQLLATAFVPEAGEGLAEADLPPITITNLVLLTESETSDNARVVAKYDIDFPVEAHAEVRFTLEKRGDTWLISNQEALAVERDGGIVVQASDEDGIPIQGVQVTIANAEAEMIRTLITDPEGLATFDDFPDPDNIVATKEDYTPSTGWSFRSGEPWKVVLRSIDSVQERNEHVVVTTVDPPLITVAQDGSASVNVIVYSVDRPSRVGLSLRDRSNASDKFTIDSDPDEVVVPESGQTEIILSISPLSNVVPGVYEVDVAPEVLEDFRVQGVGEGYASGGQKLVVSPDDFAG